MRTCLSMTVVCVLLSAPTSGAGPVAAESPLFETAGSLVSEAAGFGQGSSAGGSSELASPTARELLNKYTDALNAVRSFIARKESVKKLDYAFDRNYPDRMLAGTQRRGQRQYSRGQARTDGKRFHWRAYSWGSLGPAHGDVDETRAHYNCDNWDGVTLYGHAGNVKVPGIVTLSKPSASQVEHPMSRTPPASYLVGYNMESDERMDVMLRKAVIISVSSEMENVGGSDCYLIRARTKQGALSLWIDPAHGYNVAKAEARLSQGDLAFDYRLKRGESRVTRLENVRFERVNGVWVPMEADVSQHRKYRGGTVNEDYHYKRTEFVLNPDHDALGSFDNPIENPKNDPELKNGTDVCHLGDPDRYVWQDGKLLPDARASGDLPPSRGRVGDMRRRPVRRR